MGLFDILSWLVFGFIVGGIARYLMPGEQKMGWLMTIALGVAGSFAGGALSTLIFRSSSFVQPAGWIMSVIGALIVLFAYTKLVKKS